MLAMARLRRKFRFNVADPVVALPYGFGLDPWVFDRDALRIVARAGPTAGQLANVTSRVRGSLHREPTGGQHRRRDPVRRSS